MDTSSKVFSGIEALELDLDPLRICHRFLKDIVTILVSESRVAKSHVITPKRCCRWRFRRASPSLLLLLRTADLPLGYLYPRESTADRDGRPRPIRGPWPYVL